MTVRHERLELGAGHPAITIELPSGSADIVAGPPGMISLTMEGSRAEDVVVRAGRVRQAPHGRFSDV